MAAQHGEELTYEGLVNRWKKELRSTTVTRIDPGFYHALDAHLRALQDEYQREHAVNPSAPKVMMLQDELRNLTRARDDIYDLREKKIAIAALIAARGGNPDRGHFTKGELEVYEELVRVLKDGRRSLLRRGERDVGGRDAPALGGGGPPAPPEPSGFTPPPAAHPAATEPPSVVKAHEAPLPGLPAKEAPVAAPAPASATRVTVDGGPPPGTPRPRSGRVLVQLLKDVDAFTASDLRTYRLSADDVVALPSAEARALVGRGLARAVTS